jgi:hypothetical protein
VTGGAGRAGVDHLDPDLALRAGDVEVRAAGGGARIFGFAQGHEEVVGRDARQGAVAGTAGHLVEGGLAALGG